MAPRLACSHRPRVLGDALKGARLGGLRRYRVGDHRTIVEIQDRKVRVLAVRIGHRREVHRS